MAKWDDAVAGALEEPATDLTQAVRDELVNLWGDLDHEIRYAYNGEWSVGCEGRVRRIIALSRIVGATRWDQIQVNLLLDGTYQGILNAAGIPFEAPDMERVTKLAEHIAAGARLPEPEPQRQHDG